jgi:hypothetical protein
MYKKKKTYVFQCVVSVRERTSTDVVQVRELGDAWVREWKEKLEGEMHRCWSRTRGSPPSAR